MRTKTDLPRTRPRIAMHIMIQIKKITGSCSGNQKGTEHAMISKNKMIGTCSWRNAVEAEAASSLEVEAESSAEAKAASLVEAHGGEVPYARGSRVVWVCAKKKS